MSPSNPKKGRGTHLRLPPAPALGPTSPCQHKAVPKPGGRPAGRPPGREWTWAWRPARLRPRKPPIAGESQFPSRTGRTRFLARPSRRGKPARQPRAPSLSIQEFPEKAWRDPRRPASHARGGRLPRVAPGPAGPRHWLWARRARRNRSDVDESRSYRRLFAPHRSANSVPQISSPRFPKVLHSRTCVRWPNNAGADRQAGVGGSGGAAGRRGTTREVLGAPSPRLPSGARTRSLSCSNAGRWPFPLQYKGSLLRSHKSRQDPLFQQPFGQIEGTQLNFQMALEA